DSVPVPAKIGNGSIGKVWLRCCLLQLRDGAAFRPFIRGIERLAVEPLKGCNTHPRIDENILNLHRPKHDGIVLRKCLNPARQNEKRTQAAVSLHAANYTKAIRQQQPVWALVS